VLWKYCFDLDEYKIIKCQNVPQESAISPTILSGNIIIINEVTADPFRNICSNRLCLGKILMTQLTLMMNISKMITQF